MCIEGGELGEGGRVRVGPHPSAVGREKGREGGSERERDGGTETRWVGAGGEGPGEGGREGGREGEPRRGREGDSEYVWIRRISSPQKM